MSFSERDLQNKLDEMSADLDREVDVHSDTKDIEAKFAQVEINPSPEVQNWIDSGKNIFNSLPKFGKVAVAVGGVWIGFSIVGAVLHVVSSILSLAVIGLVLYVGYRLFNSNSESN
ncbi:hypothetical protein C7B62_13865 [Pleurocapsa sp. CCALA 161]|uniref:hypothetical protein n=1 Tax=Pleurocapsa sp. CCALA 161 TaxID=2107688 RepID=UPI000D05D9CA|nr:hypothetical protein [Pleurocapsa sp. CCALA 161]PSB09223.1 hypothetical protein C7B62_13865 [Pleurocapsa sp. CCALA 161]